jgi:hypothetical protein
MRLVIFVLLALSSFMRYALSLSPGRCLLPAAGDKGERGGIGESPKLLPGRRSACMLTAVPALPSASALIPLFLIFEKKNAPPSSLPW